MSWCEGVVVLETASVCCEVSDQGKAVIGSEKTWEDAGEAQKSGACRSTRMDRGWSLGFMQHTRGEAAERGVGSAQNCAAVCQS